MTAHLNDALRKYLTTRLSGDGLTRSFICDLLNVTKDEASVILMELGATRGKRAMDTYRMPMNRASTTDNTWGKP